MDIEAQSIYWIAVLVIITIAEIRIKKTDYGVTLLIAILGGKYVRVLMEEMLVIKIIVRGSLGKSFIQPKERFRLI